MDWGRSFDSYGTDLDRKTVFFFFQQTPKYSKFASFHVLFSDIMNNKVFYQHPNLMRILGMHETVMEVMVNVLGGDKSQV